MELTVSSSLCSNTYTPLHFSRKASLFPIGYSRCLGSFRYLRETSFAYKDIRISRRKPSVCRLSCRVRAQNTEACDASDGHHVENENDCFVLDDVPHLTDYLPDLPAYTNPLKRTPAYAIVKKTFVSPEDVVARDIIVQRDSLRGVHFRRAGPREKVYFTPEEVRACIVTCGGLCPGINTVIREIVCGLKNMYGVDDVLGIQVYIIGGDGTQKGAAAIFKEVTERGLKVAVAGIPKTIDNDIAVIDKSFGFDTAVEEAQRAINAAHVEAECMDNGVGIVKLMGRHSGSIALYATLASRDVDCCLIPESPFYLEGPDGLFQYIDQRLKENGHVLIVLAEGAGQEYVAQSMQAFDGKDASGNRLLLDVDPTYMIRAIPSNASDNIYCTLLSQSAVHGAMAGYTGFTVGPVNSRHVYIPIEDILEKEVFGVGVIGNARNRVSVRFIIFDGQVIYA
nr:ATP-dependent 6-phosphofructokinase 4, chloroplastic-like [Ipomoea trifida]